MYLTTDEITYGLESAESLCKAYPTDPRCRMVYAVLNSAKLSLENLETQSEIMTGMTANLFECYKLAYKIRINCTVAIRGRQRVVEYADDLCHIENDLLKLVDALEVINPVACIEGVKS